MRERGRGVGASSGVRVKSVRCAIYTRKSSEEGLEQDFNSLHAQREACESYIASQRHEGWKVLPTAYDDGGYSGGSMERPGLQKLLADIQSGMVDIVVVYKVDRLTRSLTDFARIVESFDARGVSFVSVTQAFNTTTSMGRLTLNVLLSFAQFEREVTGERIRDKIAASKRKGLWMGGFVPMGYKAVGRTLEIVDGEADIIRRIFERFLEMGSVKHLKAQLDARGVTTRAFTSASNRDWGNRPFSIGHLRSILKNPIYAGAIAHKGEIHPGQHGAIIETEQFDRVQDLISSRAHHHKLRMGADHPNLLAGLVWDQQGNRLFSTHTSKQGKRYRYYTSQSDGAEIIRIPAADLEALVVDTVAAKLGDSNWLEHHLVDPDASPDEIESIFNMAQSLAADVQRSGSSEQQTAIQSVIDSVMVGPDHITIGLKADIIIGAALLYADQDTVSIELPNPFLLRRQTLHHIMASEKDRPAASNKTLVKAIARGWTWYTDLVSGRAESARHIALQENLDERYVSQLVRLAFLDPQVIGQILEGDKAVDIASADIARGLDLPMLWSEQTAAL